MVHLATELMVHLATELMVHHTTELMVHLATEPHTVFKPFLFDFLMAKMLFLLWFLSWFSGLVTLGNANTR